MLSHAIPSTDRACAPPPESLARPAEEGVGVGGPGGPLPVAFHPSLRRQGSDFNPGVVPAGAGEGRLRGCLRLSVARRAVARLRRAEAPGGDRRALGDAAAVFAGPRRLRDRAPRHERDPAHGFGGAGHARRAAEGVARPRTRSGFRRAGAQVPDLGAVALCRSPRGGAGPRPDAEGGAGRGGASMTEARRHVPVLLDEVLQALDPRPGAVIVDGTFGAGGYARALLE